MTGNIRVHVIFANLQGTTDFLCKNELISFKNGRIFNLTPTLESEEPPLSQNPRNFPVAKLPTVQIREIFMLQNFPVIQ